MGFLNSKEKKGGGAFAVLIGLAVLIIFTVVLFNNEGNSVSRAKALKNIEDAVEITSDDTSDSYENQLVLFSGVPVTNQKLTDETFGVTAMANAIKMERKVEIYQWKEISKKDDDTTTYEYEQVWSNQLIDSSNFNTPAGHENPKTKTYEDQYMVVNEIGIGKYTLGGDFIKQLNHYEPYEKLDTKGLDIKNTTATNNMFYISNNGSSNINAPQVGDYTIKYEFVPASLVTVLGQKRGTSLIAYSTKTGKLAEVSYGEKDKVVFMNEKLDANKRKTWGIRIGSLIALMIAVGMVFSPLTNLVGKIPLLGNIINGGFMLIAVALGGAWGIFVIAFGWLFFKPFLAIGLIAAVVAALILLSKKNKQEGSQQINQPAKDMA